MDEDRLRELVKKLPPEDATVLLWHLQRRSNQIAPTPLPFIWIIRAGRGAGKTHTAANHVFEWTKNMPILKPKDRIIRVALVGETMGDVKHTMVEGDSGLLNVIPENQILAWNRTMGELRYELLHPTRREVICQAYSSEKPDQLRGPQHNVGWIDEVAKLRDANEDPMKAGTTFSNLYMGLRLGQSPHLIITGTPTPCLLVKYLDKREDVVTTQMASFDNRGNISEKQLKDLENIDPRSRFYQQEVLGNILWETPDALFFQANIDENRKEAPDDLELILGYDPAVNMGTGEDSDESGIVLVGFKQENNNNHTYVLEDYSGHYLPKAAMDKVTSLILNYRIKTLCIELNQGLGFVITALRQAIEDKTTCKIREMPTKKVPYGKITRWKVITSDHIFYIHGIQSTQGKQLRAESASIAYEMNLVHHAKPLDVLEEQMTFWSPNTTKDSPDRLDALVFTLLEVYGEKIKSFSPPAQILVPGDQDLASFGAPTKGKRNPYDYEPQSTKHIRMYNLDI